MVGRLVGRVERVVGCVGGVAGCVGRVVGRMGVVARSFVGSCAFAPSRRDQMRSSACCLSVGTPTKYTKASK